MHWLPQKRDPYAWYIRVADVADFLRTISPVLEDRLAESVMVGYSGELRLNFYREWRDRDVRSRSHNRGEAVGISRQCELIRPSSRI